MDTGTLSPVAVLRDAPSALLRMRVDDFYRYDSNFEIAVLVRARHSNYMVSHGQQRNRDYAGRGGGVGLMPGVWSRDERIRGG